MRWSRLILLTLLAFALVLLWQFPASWARPLLPAEMKCSSLDGSVWSGDCKRLTWGRGSQPIQITGVHWHALPLQLFRGRLAAQVQLEHAAGNASGRVSLGLGNRIAVSDLSGAGVMDHSLLSALPAGWHARIQLSAVTLAMQGARLASLGGQIHAVDVTDEKGHVLGSYVLAMDLAHVPPFTGHLSNSGGPVQLQADVKVAQDTSWELDGTVIANADASASLQQQLQMLGPPDASGRRRISVAGTL